MALIEADDAIGAVLLGDHNEGAVGEPEPGGLDLAVTDAGTASGPSTDASCEPDKAAPRAGIVLYMPEQLDLTIVYEPGDEGWIIASIPEVPEVFSQGRTQAEARTNVIDALRLMLSPEPGEADDRREREALHLTIAA